MKIIKACFILYYQEDKQACSNTHGKACNINGSVTFVAPQASECSFKIIFKHKKQFMVYSARLPVCPHQILFSSSLKSSQHPSPPVEKGRG
jgi:hypothetical protein